MININILRYLYNKGYTSREIARKMKVEKSAVLRVSKKNNILFAQKPKRPDTIDPIVVKKLVKRNYSTVEIAKMLNTHRSTINRICKLHKINRHYNIALTKREAAIIIGTLLGDASFIFSGVQTSLICTHSLAQKEYCIWKFKQLKRLKTRLKINKRNLPDPRNNKKYESICFNTKSFLNLTKWYKLMYTPKKIIPKDLLIHYNNLSLAVHFMDDGYKSNHSYILCTDSFDKESLKNYIDMCKIKFGLNWVINKRNRLYLPAAERNKFKKIVKQYIHKDCEYKLHE